MSTIDLHDHDARGLARAGRWRMSRLAWATIALAGLLAAGALVGILSTIGARQPAARSVATVPDLLLAPSYDQTSQTSSLHALLPATQEVRTLLDGVDIQGNPAISPDGRQLLVRGWEVADGTVTAAVYSFDSATMAFQWRAAIVSEPVTTDGTRTQTSVVFAGDRVYVASQRWLSTDPIALQALDRATGTPAGSWTLDTGDLASNAPWLYASPDGADLYALFDLWEGPGPNPKQAGVGYVHYRLPDMREVGRQAPLADGAVWGWGALPAPDGRTLFSIGFFGQSQPPQVRFFDLATGEELPPLSLPFASASGLIQHAVSPDGARLYLFDPTSGDLAVVDLATRSVVEQVVVDMSVARGGGSLLGRVWSAVRGAFVQDAAAKVYIQGGMQLSPDGNRLYAVGVEGDFIGGAPRGVLVIDTRTWQVVDRWLTDAHPTQVILGGDGRYLYVQTTSWGGDGANEFRVVDTTSGQDDLAVDLPTGGTAWSLAELYRDTWGRAPAIAGSGGRSTAKSPAGEADPFAKLDVSVNAASVVAGDPVTVEARFLDPATGEVVRSGQDDVRFTLPDHVQATFSRGVTSEEGVTIVLTQAEEGVYRGAALLPAAGSWSLDVTVRTSGEPLRRAGIAAAVVVQPALTGSDGNRYVLRVTTDPATPAANVPFTVRAAFVDARTGAPLAKGSSLLNGEPARIDISLMPTNGSGVTTATLEPAGDGSYAGTAKVWQPGRWTIQADFPGDGINGSFPTGVVEVE